MEAPKNMDKATWMKEMLHIFCDLCIKAIDMGMRPNTHFDKAGWKYLLASFKEHTSHAFTKAQLKNKWDHSKKDWMIWKNLISETGMGWSTNLGTIYASDERWKSKIQEIRGAKKFRHASIEPLLCMKYDRMFANIIATGEYVWAPSSRVLPDHNVGVDGNQHTHVEQPDLEEGSGDSEEDGIPNFSDDVCNMVRGVNMSTSSNNHSSGRRKERQRFESSSQPTINHRHSPRSSLICIISIIDDVLSTGHCENRSPHNNNGQRRLFSLHEAPTLTANIHCESCCLVRYSVSLLSVGAHCSEQSIHMDDASFNAIFNEDLDNDYENIMERVVDHIICRDDYDNSGSSGDADDGANDDDNDSDKDGEPFWSDLETRYRLKLREG
nr:uncharacterized protein LOC118027890 [Populus alba]